MSIEEPPVIPSPTSDEGKVGLAKEARKAARTRQFDLDVRGVLAILALAGALGLSFAALFTTRNHTADIPTWAASMVAAVLGFYFGARSGGPSGGNGSSSSK